MSLRGNYVYGMTEQMIISLIDLNAFSAISNNNFKETIEQRILDTSR